MAKTLFEWGDFKCTDETKKYKTEVVNGKEVWIYAFRGEIFWYYPATGKSYIVDENGDLQTFEAKQLKEHTQTGKRTFKWLIVAAVVVFIVYSYKKKG